MSGGDLELEELGPIKHITARECAAALKTVCAYAENAAEAMDFAEMLGLKPGVVVPPACLKCGRPMSWNPRPGQLRHGSDGLCATCTGAARKEAADELLRNT